MYTWYIIYLRPPQVCKNQPPPPAHKRKHGEHRNKQTLRVPRGGRGGLDPNSATRFRARLHNSFARGGRRQHSPHSQHDAKGPPYNTSKAKEN